MFDFESEKSAVSDFLKKEFPGAATITYKKGLTGTWQKFRPSWGRGANNPEIQYVAKWDRTQKRPTLLFSLNPEQYDKSGNRTMNESTQVKLKKLIERLVKEESAKNKFEDIRLNNKGGRYYWNIKTGKTVSAAEVKRLAGNKEHFFVPEQDR